MKNYWAKENPEYINIKIRIEQIQSKINQGIITNETTLKFKRKELNNLRKKLANTNQYI